MDTIRFLSFLQDFAANNVQKSTSTTPHSGTTQSSTDLASTFNAFEAQLKALMGQAAAQTTPTPSETSVFVVGGSANDSHNTTPEASMLATQAMLSRAFGADGMAQASTATASPDPAKLSAHDNTLREIIAWRREQIDPMLHVKVGDLWDRQGITDPMNDPKLLADAQSAHDRAMSRKAQMPGLVAHWEGDWRTQLATDRQNLADQRIQSAANSASSPFVIGGGHA